MPEPVQAVECKRPRHERLEADLEENGESREAGRQTRAFEVPAEEGSGEVRGAEDVDGAGHGGARDSVQHGRVPCDLGPVDAEMGGYGPVGALGGEDVGACGLGCRDCCCLSV